MSWDEFFARRRRRERTVLVVGNGRIGSRCAIDLARDGVDLLLVDHDVVEQKNVADQEFEHTDVGRAKAVALAEHVRRRAPDVDVEGVQADFLALPPDVQSRLVQSVDVVLAATDNEICQLRINEVALAAEVEAVYPGIWDDPALRPGEIGEVIWVMPGRHTPCYMCATRSRDHAATVAPREAARWVDTSPLVYATVQTVRALLSAERAESSWLIPPAHRRRSPPPNIIYVHGLGPVSDTLLSRGAALFDPERPLGNRHAFTEFLPNCPACGGRPTPGRDQAPARTRDRQADLLERRMTYGRVALIAFPIVFLIAGATGFDGNFGRAFLLCSIAIFGGAGAMALIDLMADRVSLLRDEFLTPKALYASAAGLGIVFVVFSQDAPWAWMFLPGLIAIAHGGVLVYDATHELATTTDIDAPETAWWTLGGVALAFVILAAIAGGGGETETTAAPSEGTTATAPSTAASTTTSSTTTTTTLPEPAWPTGAFGGDPAFIALLGASLGDYPSSWSRCNTNWCLSGDSTRVVLFTRDGLEPVAQLSPQGDPASQLASAGVSQADIDELLAPN